MNLQIKHLLTLTLFLMCVAYSSAQVVLGSENKYKIYFEERTVCLADTTILVKVEYVCNLTDGHLADVHVALDTRKTQNHDYNEDNNRGRIGTKTTRVGNVSMVNSVCKISDMIHSDDKYVPQKRDERLSEAVFITAVIDDECPERSQLYLSTAFITDEEFARYYGEK